MLQSGTCRQESRPGKLLDLQRTRLREGSIQRWKLTCIKTTRSALAQNKETIVNLVNAAVDQYLIDELVALRTAEAGLRHCLVGEHVVGAEVDQRLAALNARLEEFEAFLNELAPPESAHLI